MTTEFSVGQRISSSGQLGTIKYLGCLPDSSDSWLGIEWDNDLRGKHSGTYKGLQIFQCRPGAGSFVKVKAAQKFDQPKTLIEALQDKYLDTTMTNEFTSLTAISSKPVQSIGFAKLAEHFKCYESATELFVAHACIRRIGDLKTNLPSKIKSVAS